MKQSIAPVAFAAILLFLPGFYLASYVALIEPRPDYAICANAPPPDSYYPYRFGGARAATIFSPLELLDRKLRPRAWAAMTWHEAMLQVTTTPNIIRQREAPTTDDQLGQP